MPTRPSPSSVAVATLALLLAAPASASAQRAGDATLPFHAGQWGLSVNVGQSTGVGVQRFTAPNRALTIDVAGFVRREARYSVTTPFSTQPGYHYVSGNASVALGLRHYRPLTSTVAMFHTIGVDGLYTGGGGGTPHSWSTGVFGSLGAQYMLDPRFSLGVAAGLRVGYSEDRFSFGGGTVARTTSVGLGTTPARLIGAVYF